MSRSDKDGYKFIIRQELGALLILEKKHSWFHTFRPSNQFYWHHTKLYGGQLPKQGPFKSMHAALTDFRKVKEMMKNADKTIQNEKKTSISLPESPKPPTIPGINVVFVDFQKRMKIVKKI
jgi:hypothetical protein